MKTLTTLEKQVLEMLLHGQDEVLTVLRRQAKRLEVTSREMTGVGFYTEFSVPYDAPRVPGGLTFKLGDVNGTADNVSHGLGFLLYVKDGALGMLEGYTYEEPWPVDVRGLVLTYASKEGRKLDFQTSHRN
ncbi:MAG: hypothetical protein ACRD3L_02685 [Terriglobales bacterium]